MAWAEKLQSGKWRGGWRTPDGTKVYTRKSTHPEHPYPTKRAALDAAREAEVRAARRASVEAGVAAASITWGDYWDSTYTEREDTDTAPVAQGIVTKYIRPKWGETPLNAIRQRDVKAWVADLLVGREASYAAKIYGVFRASINTAMDGDPPLLDASPCARVRIRVPDKPKPVREDVSLDELRPYLLQVYQDMVDFGQETGLRPGEMSGLHAAQIDRRSGWVTVDKTFVSRRRLIRHSPKDNEARDVPLTDRAADIIARNLDGRDPAVGCSLPHVHRGKPARKQCRSPLVFLNGDLPITANSFWKALQRAAERSGVAPVKPYDSRHWFITRALAGGLDVVTVAQLVGHADVKQTQAYAWRTPAVRDRLRVALGEAPSLTAVGSPVDTLRQGAVGSGHDGAMDHRTGS